LFRHLKYVNDRTVLKHVQKRRFAASDIPFHGDCKTFFFPV
jgi:hypothetical protein